MDKVDAKVNRWWAILIGTGLALFAIHSQWLTELVTKDSEVGFFIPAFGTAIWIMATLCFIVWNWERFNWRDWGDRRVYIPLLVIVVSIGLSGVINAEGWRDKISPLLMGISFLALYLVSQKLGKDIFIAFIPFVAIVAISCIVDGILTPGKPTGGMITNYCASIGFMIFGTIVNRFKWQWILATLVLAAIFFAGALEGLFAAIVLGIIVIARRDWSKRLILPASLIIVLSVSWFAFGHFTPLWGKNNFSPLVGMITGKVEVSHEALNVATTGRWINIVNRMSDIKPLGRGFWITMPQRADSNIGYYEYSSPDLEPVHNVPLVIVDQVGLVAGIAWLFITIFCLVKTKWKYAWSAILILSVFDHFIWTQFAPYWWALIGVSSTSTIKSDLIFRKKELSTTLGRIIH